MARLPENLHPDIAAYIVQQAEKWDHPPAAVAGRLASTYQLRQILQDLAKSIDSEKLAGIAQSVADIEDQREREGIRCRRKVTEKQRYALAVALLEKFGTPREIVKAAWGMTDEEIDNANA